MSEQSELCESIADACSVLPDVAKAEKCHDEWRNDAHVMLTMQDGTKYVVQVTKR